LGPTVERTVEVFEVSTVAVSTVDTCLVLLRGRTLQECRGQSFGTAMGARLSSPWRL